MVLTQLRSTRFIVVAGMLIGLLVPAAVNPFSDRPFEPPKVIALVVLVLSMAVAGGANEVWRWRRESAWGLSDTFANRVRSWLARPLVLPILVYLLVRAASTLISISFWGSLWGGGTMVQGLVVDVCLCALCLMLSAALHSRASISGFTATLVAGGVPVATYGIIQYLGLDPLGWVTDAVSPVLSTLGRSNYVGAYLAVLLPLEVGGALSLTGPGARWRYAPVIGLQLICLVLTQARAAYLATTAGVWLLLLLLALRRRQPIFLAASAGVLAIGIVGLALLNTQELPAFKVRQTAENALTSGEFQELRAESMNQRLIIWKNTLTLIPARWFLGYGPAAFRTVFSAGCAEMTDLPPAVCEALDDPHNLLLSLTIASGVSGLVALLWLFCEALRCLIRLFRRTGDRHEQAMLAGYIGALIAFLAQAQFNRQEITVTTTGWLVLALAAGLCQPLRASSSQVVIGR